MKNKDINERDLCGQLCEFRFFVFIQEFKNVSDKESITLGKTYKRTDEDWESKRQECSKRREKYQKKRQFLEDDEREDESYDDKSRRKKF